MKLFPLFGPVMLLASLAGVALAGASEEEVTHLLVYLETSACRFNRNGAWYDNREAAAHLRQKYAYLLDKGRVSSAESFIEDAASRSSISGQPYTVSCEGSAEVESSAWFRAELDRFRRALEAAPVRDGDTERVENEGRN